MFYNSLTPYRNFLQSWPHLSYQATPTGQSGGLGQPTIGQPFDPGNGAPKSPKTAPMPVNGLWGPFRGLYDRLLANNSVALQNSYQGLTPARLNNNGVRSVSDGRRPFALQHRMGSRDR